MGSRKKEDIMNKLGTQRETKGWVRGLTMVLVLAILITTITPAGVFADPGSVAKAEEGPSAAVNRDEEIPPETKENEDVLKEDPAEKAGDQAEESPPSTRGIRPMAAPVPVSDWAALRAAMGNTGVDKIVLSGNILRSSPYTAANDLPVVTRDLEIDGGGYTLDFGSSTGLNRSFHDITLGQVSAPKRLYVHDLKVRRSYHVSNDGTTYLKSHMIGHDQAVGVATTSNWTVAVGDLEYLGGGGNGVSRPNSGFIQITESVVEMEGHVSWDSDYYQNANGANNNNGLVQAKEITFQENAVVRLAANDNVVRLRGSDATYTGSNVRTVKFIAKKGADVEIEVKDSSTNNGQGVGMAVYINTYDSNGANANHALVDISGEGTRVYAHSRKSGKTTYWGYGTFYIGGRNADVNIIDKARFEVESENMQSAMVCQSPGSDFTVENATLNITSRGDDTGNFTAATLWFRLVGDQTFNLRNKARVNILNKGEGAGCTAGIRAYGDNNAINVSGGSQFIIRNIGYNGGNWGQSSDGRGNQGIETTAGTGFNFTITDHKSAVEIYAEKGLAIDNKRLAGSTITLGPGAIFVANGQSRAAGDGIFRGGSGYNFQFDNPLYFDFANTRPGGGQVFDIRGGTFQALNTDIAVWKTGNPPTGTPISGNAYKSWSKVSFGLSGTDFGTFTPVSGGDLTAADFGTGTNGMPSYTRLNGNNASPVADDMLEATNADQYVRAHVKIPEGTNDEGRPPFDDEVYGVFQVTPADGSPVRYETGKSINAETVYGTARRGMLRLDVGHFLNVGDKYQLVQLWRGNSNPNSPKSRPAKPEDITTKVITVVDATPPNPADITSPQILYANQRDLSGTWSDGPVYNADPPVKVIAYDNGNPIRDGGAVVEGTLRADHTWSYRIPAGHTLTPGHQISIVLVDGLGNENPLTVAAWHDAVFLPAPLRTVEAVKFQITLTRDVRIGTEEAIKLDPANEATFLSLHNVKGFDLSKPAGSQDTPVIVKSIQPAPGWDRVWETWPAAPPVIQKTYHVTYAIAAEPGFTEPATVVVYNAERVAGDGEYVVGANHIRRINTTAARSITDSQLISLAKAWAQKVTPAAAAEVEVDGRNFPQNGSEGVGTVTFRVKAKPAVKVTVNILVSDGDRPILTVTTPIHISIGGIFQYGAGVSAYDTEDYDLTGKIVSSGAVNPNIKGFYPVQYSVVDSDFNQATAARTVAVGMGAPGDRYYLDANSFVITDGALKDSPVSAKEDQIRLLSGAQTFTLTGMPTNAAIRVKDDGGYRHLQASDNGYAEFTIVLDVPGDPKTPEKTIKAIVVPEVVSKDGYHISWKNPTIRVSEAMQNSDDKVKAWTDAKGFFIDNNTGAVSPKGLTVAQNDVQASAGVYDAVFRIVENSQEKVRATAKITVSDGNGPQLTVNPGTVSIPVGGTFQPMSGVAATDLEDDAAGVPLNITSSGVVDVNTRGVYTVHYGVKDSDGNAAGASRVVFVGYHQIGPYYVSASDFIIENSKVITAPALSREAQILTMAALEIRSSTGALATDAVGTVTDFGGYDRIGPQELQKDFSVVIGLKDLSGLPLSGQTGIQAKVINGTVGSKYYIVARDFRIQVNEAKLNTSAKAIGWAGAEAYNIKTGAQEGEILVVSNGVAAKTGIYDVVFTVKEEQSLTHGIKGEVYSTAKPVLTVPTPSEVPLGGSFDPMQNVSAHDAVDLDITGKVVVTANNVDLNTPGVYTIAYAVKNSNDQEAAATRVVVVNDGSFSVGTNYILKAKSFVIRQAEASMVDSHNQILSKSGAKAWSSLNGQEVAPTILSDGGYYDGQKMVCDIRLGVGADAGTTPESAKAIRDIRAKIIPKDIIFYGKDYIIGADHFKINPTEETGVTNETLMTRSAVEVWRWDDALTPVKQTVTDGAGFVDYKGKRDGTTGLFDLVMNVKDEPATRTTVRVQVTGGAEPVLSVTSPVIISAGAVFDYGAGIAATDAEDDAGSIPLIITSSGAVDVQVAGVYQVTYSVTDSDYNTVTKVRDVIVNDGSIIVGSRYILQARNFVSLVDSMTGTDQEILGKSRAVAWEFRATGGAILASDKLVVISNGGYQKAVNDYSIQVGVRYGSGSGTTTDPVADITGRVMGGTVLDEDQDYVVVASGASITVSVAQALSDSKLVEWTHAKGFRKSDLREVALAVGPHNVQKTEGSYTAAFSIQARPSVGVTAPVNVTKGDAPVLSIQPNPQVIPIGSGPYAYDAGVSATDSEDDARKIPLVITHAGVVKTDLAGVYPITYAVTDSDGNTTKDTRVVVVDDGNIVVGDRYILRARSFVIKGNEVALSASDRKVQILDRSKAEAWNKKTGQLLEATVLVDGGYRADENTYDIVVAAKDDYNVLRNIKARVVVDTIVVDAGDYFIAGNPILMNTKVDKTKPDLVTLGKVKAFKANDALTPGTPVFDEPVYTGSFDGTPGTYKATFFVQEKTTNILKDLEVVVSDRSKPVLTVDPAAVLVSVGGVFNVMDGVSATDAEDDLAGKPLRITHSGIVEVNREGIFHVTYSVTDSDYNTVTKDRTVFVGGNRLGNYILYAANFGVKSADVVTSPAVARDKQILDASLAKVYDLKGNLATPPAIVSDPGGYRQLTAQEASMLFNIRLGIQGVSGTVGITARVGHQMALGNQYGVTAGDFQIFIADAKALTDAKLIQWAKAVSFDAKTFLDAGTVKVDGHTIEEKRGIFTATFSVVEEPAVKITVNVNVESRNAPVITVSSPAEIPVGGAFDPLQGAAASDVEDGDLTGRIVVTANNVKTTEAGVYVVTYSVTDSDNQEGRGRRVVVVNDGDYAVGTNYILRARSFVVRKADVDRVHPEDQIHAKGEIKAWNAQTGAEANTILLDDGGYYTDGVTTYAISAGVAMDAGTMPASDRAIRNIKAYVVDKDVIREGKDYIIAANNFRVNTTDDRNITDGELLKRAGAQAWKKNTALTPATPEYAGYDGFRNGTVGIFNLDLRVRQEPATDTRVHVQVSDVPPPVLTVDSPLRISLGGTFDYRVSAAAVAWNGTDLTGRITCSGIVDTGTTGVYPLTYAVTDDEYNTAGATRVVMVGDIVEGDKYLLQASNFVALKKNVTGTDAEIISESETKIWDKKTGLEVTGVAEVRDSGGYKAAAGDYDIRIGAIGDPPAEKAVKAKVVDGDKLTDDGEYIITAKDVKKTISVAQAEYSETRLLQWANVSAFKKSDLSPVAARVGANNNVNKNAAGLYHSDYEVTAKPAVKVDGAVEITKGDSPVLTVQPETHVVSRAATGQYDYLYGVTVTDTEDDAAGKPVSLITAGAVDLAKDGVSIVTYAAIDSDGNQVEKTRVVVVDDGTYVVKNNYILKAHSFVVRGADVKNTAQLRLTQILDLSEAAAWNAKTGQPADVQVIGSGGYSSKKDVYDITVAVRQDNNVHRDIRAMVVDDDMVVSSGDYYLVGNPFRMNRVVDMSNPDLADLGKVRAFKRDDGLTAGHVSLENYTGRFDGTPGDYVGTFRVDEQITSKMDLPIKVDDGNKPTLTVKTPIHIPVHGTFDYKADVTAWDVEDKDLTAKITSGGGVDPDTEGIYIVKYSVTDSDYLTTSADRVVIVGGIVGDKYALFTGSYAIEDRMVVDSPAAAKDSQILASSRTEAYHLSDGSPAPGALLRVKNDGGYRHLTAGEVYKIFNITIDIADDVKATDNIKALVGQNVISGPYHLVYGDFTLKISEAKTATDSKILQWTGAQAFRASDMAAGTVEVSSSAIQPAKGIYDVDLRVRETIPPAQGPLVQGTAKATVTDSPAPILSVPTPSEIPLGGSFDPMKNVTAGDSLDGDITSLVTQSGLVNTNQAGVYTVDYFVKNSNDVPATARRVVVVNDGNYSVGKYYILHANSFVIRKADADPVKSHDQIFARGQLAAWSALTGAPTTPVILEDSGYYDGSGTDFAIKVGVSPDGGTMPESERAIRNIRALVVDKGLIVDGPEYTIAADPFRVNRTDETGITNPQLLQRAGAQAWKRDSALTPATPEYLSYTGYRNGTSGLYDLDIRVRQEPVTQVRVQVQVADIPAPTLTVTSPVHISIGGVFAPMSSVSAISAKDGDITGKVTFSGVVDPNTEGVYTMLYQVVDSEYNVVNATRVICAGDIVEGDQYLLSAKNFVALKKNVTGTDADILARSGAQAWDKFTGREEQSVLEVRDNGGYQAAVNDYNIRIGARGDARAEQTVKAKVVDGDQIFDDGEYIITARDVQKTISVAQAEYTEPKLLIWADVQAFKKADLSPVSAKVGQNDVNKNAVGLYHADYEVMSKPAVKINGEVSITTGDPPVLTVQPSPHEVARDSGPYDYFHGVSATDTEDDAAGKSVKITTAGAVDTGKDGVYTVVYTAEDSDGNKEEETRVVVVNDGNYRVTPDYILSAHSFVIKGSDVAPTDATKAAQILTESEAQAWDAKTGQPVDATLLNGGGYKNVKNTYPVTIAVKTDTRVTRDIQAEVVDDVIVVSAGDYYLVGNPILMNTTEDLAHPDLGVLGKVRAVKKDDQMTTGTAILEHYTGQFNGVQGTFKATFHVDRQPASKMPLDVVVRNAPRANLDVTTPVHVPVGGSFDYAGGVSAASPKDGDLTPKVISSGAVDTGTQGIYKVTYSVTDSDYQTVSKERIVVVGGIVGDKYIFFADSFIIKSDDVVESPVPDRQDQIIQKSNAKAWFLDGTPAPGAQIRVRNDGGYRKLTDGEGAKPFDINLDIADDVKCFRDIKALVARDFISGADYILTWQDFTIRVSEAKSNSDSQAKIWSQAKAWRKWDMAEADVVVDANHIQAKVGVYDLDLSVRQEPATTGTAKANVTALSKNTTLTVKTPVEIVKGGAYDPMKDVSAIHTADGDITGLVTINGGNGTTVDPGKPGVYTDEYEVTDADNITFTAKRVVVVNDKTYSVGTRYILKANSFVIRRADADPVHSEDQIMTEAGVMAWDANTGQTVDPIVLDRGGYYDGVSSEFAISLGVALDATTTPASDQAIRNIRAKVVDKDVLVAGADYIIAAENFRINTTEEKGVSDGDLLLRSGTTAWMNDDALTPVPARVFQYTGTRNGTPSGTGGWDLTVHPVADASVKGTVKVTVDDGNAPVLSAATPVNLTVGDSFQYMTSVSAIDAEDGDLTNKVTFAGVVDTNRKGVYTVTYAVTDRDHNTETATRVVAVGPMIIGDRYIIDGENFVILLDDVTGTDGQILGRAGAKAWDRFTGAEANDKLEVRDNGGYQKVAKDYSITIGAQGDAKAEQGVVGKVVPGSILIDDGEYIIAADHVTVTISIAQAQYSHARLIQWAGAKAWKKATLSETAVEVGANNVDSNRVGHYTADYQVKARPATKAGAHVDIIKGKPPVLTVAPNPHEVLIGSGPYDHGFGVTVTDEEDDAAGLPVALTITAGAVDTARAGVYKAWYSAVDADGNRAETTRLVVVNDGTIIMTPDYILKAESFVIAKDDVIGTEPGKTGQLLAKTKAKAWEVRTGNETPAVILSGGGYDAVANTYRVDVAVGADRNVNKRVDGVVLGDKLVVETAGYFIAGNPIQMNTTVDKTRPDLITMGAVRAFEKGIGLTPAAVQMDSYTGKFDGTQGTFDAAFSVAGHPADALKDLKVRVTDGKPPQLHVDTPVMVPIHGSYDHGMGVRATDDEDDAAGKPLAIVSSGAVDVNTKGFYRVHYSVTDSDHNTVTKERLVCVGYVLGDKYIFDAEDFAILSKDVVDGPDMARHAQIMTASVAQAWNLDGTPAPAAPIRVAHDGGYGRGEGLYNIKMEIAGDPKAAKEIVARVLDGGVLVEGPDYILTVSDFTISVNEAKSLSDQKQISWAKARSYDKKNKYAPAGRVILEKSEIQPKKGAWDVVFAVAENPAVKATAIATVAGGNPPVLTVPTPAEIPVGGSYDPYKNVSAHDDEDGDLTKEIQVTSNVNSGKSGLYIDVYSVKDSDDNVSEAKRVVVVNDGTWSVGTRYILKADSFVIKKAEAKTMGSEEQILQRSGARAWSAITGDEVSPAVLSGDGYYDGVRDKFAIRLGVGVDQSTMPASARATRNITARVLDREEVVVTSEYIIGANHVRMNRSEETGITNAQLISRAGAVAFRVSDGLESVPVNLKSYNGTRNGIKGIFDLAFDLTQSPSTEIKVRAWVTDGAKPVLTATSPVEIQKGTPMDYMAGVSATDPEDGNLTNQVHFTRTVDENIAGVYTVPYTVMDSDFNETQTTRVVVVNDGTLIIGADTIVEAKGFVIRKKDVSGTDQEILSQSGARAWKKQNGVLTPDAAIVQSNGGYRDQAGDYNIAIGVAGDASARADIIGKVTDDQIIFGSEEYVIVANPVVVDLAQAQAELSGSKLLDWSKAKAWNRLTMQPVAVRIRSTNAVAAAGIYNVAYEVTSHPATGIDSTVQITQGEAPKISVTPNPHTVQLGSGAYPYTMGVTATDREDGVITDRVTYSGIVDTSKAGVYQVTFSVTDSNGNAASVKRTVVVNDDTFIVTATHILKAESFVIKGAEVPMASSARIPQILAKSFARAWQTETAQEVPVCVASAGGYGPKDGTYGITIAVDANRTVTRQIKGRVVEDSIVVKEGSYYIVGNPIHMSSATDKTRPNLVDLGSVRAYKNNDSLTPSQVTLKTYNGKYDGKAGTYRATFTATADPRCALKDLEVVVRDSNKPTLEITTPIVIAKGSIWDPLVGTRASDPEDDAAGIPLVIKHTGHVNTAAEGLYKITYSVTDSDYNTVSKTRLVAVGDYILGDGYLLQANHFAAGVMEISGGNEEILLRSGARAWNAGGEELKAEVKSDGGYRKEGGLWQITLGVAGKQGLPEKVILANISAKTFTVLFDSNGADTWASPWFRQLTQPATQVGALPDKPARKGYTFSGWNTERSGGGTAVSGATQVSGDLTVYARWQINRYSMSFRVNGGKSKAPATQTIPYSGLAAAPRTPTHANKSMEFRGWNTRANGSGTFWNFSETRMPANNTVLYAIWGKKGETVTKVIEKPVVVREKETVTVTKTRNVYVPRTVTNTVTTQVPVPIVTTVSTIQPADPAATQPTDQAPAGTAQPSPEPVHVGEASQPTAEEGSWALLNLLLLLIGFAIVILCMMIMILRRKDEERDPWNVVKNIIGAVIAAIAAIVNLVIYTLTQDGFEKAMTLMDRYTLVSLIVFIILTVGVVAALRKFDEIDTEESEATRPPTIQ